MKVEALFQPRGAQIEALYALKNSRREGAKKGAGPGRHRCGQDISGGL